MIAVVSNIHILVSTDLKNCFPTSFFRFSCCLFPVDLVLDFTFVVKNVLNLSMIVWGTDLKSPTGTSGKNGYPALSRSRVPETYLQFMQPSAQPLR